MAAQTKSGISKAHALAVCASIVLAAAVVLLARAGEGQTPAAQAWTAYEGPSPMAMPPFSEKATGDSSGSYSTVAMGDVDGQDGRAEILSGGHSRGGDTKGLYLWRHSGTAWAKQTITDTGSYGGVALADINGDDILDAIAAGDTGWGSDEVQDLAIWKASVAGGAIVFAQLSTPYDAASGDCVAVGDIEHDGDNDIVLGTNGAGIKVFVNSGAATPSWTTVSISTGTGETTGVALGDLNNDNLLDIAATNYNGDNSRVFLCSAGSLVTFGNARAGGLGTGTGFGIAIANFNNDNYNDLAIGTRGGFKAYLGTGCAGADDTKWWTEATVSGDTGSGDRMQVAAGDINDDGKMDIAVATGSGMVFLEGNGGGSFTCTLPGGIPEYGSFYGCCLYDADGDGDLDLAACGWGAGVRFYENNLGAGVAELPLGVMALAAVATAAASLAIAGRRKNN